MGGWVGEERLVGRRPGPRVLSENNNTPDLGAYTFKAGPAPPAPSRPPAEVSRSWRWAGVNLTRSPRRRCGRSARPRTAHRVGWQDACARR